MTTPQLTMQIDGLDRALAMIAQVQSADLPRAIGVAVAEFAVLPIAKVYPSPSGRKMPIKSAAQRRLIFAKIRRGEIPYRRTYRLMQAWRFAGLPDGATVTNAAPYAGLVVGDEQAAYHAGTWETVSALAARVEAGPAAQVGEAAAGLFIVRAGLG